MNKLNTLRVKAVNLCHSVSRLREDAITLRHELLCLNTEPISAALSAVAVERERQRTKWGDDHDDAHCDGQLARIAACFAAGSVGVEPCMYTYTEGSFVSSPLWPWPAGKGCHRASRTPMQNLVIAGAFIQAEIERRLRAGETL